MKNKKILKIKEEYKIKKFKYILQIIKKVTNNIQVTTASKYIITKLISKKYKISNDMIKIIINLKIKRDILIKKNKYIICVINNKKNKDDFYKLKKKIENIIKQNIICLLMYQFKIIAGIIIHYNNIEINYSTMKRIENMKLMLKI